MLQRLKVTSYALLILLLLVLPSQAVAQCNTQDACAAAAQAKGLILGGNGYAFAGSYGTKGCYSYESGKYQGMAYFGTGGTETAMRATPAKPKYRIETSCEGPQSQAAGAVCHPSDGIIERYNTELHESYEYSVGRCAPEGVTADTCATGWGKGRCQWGIPPELEPLKPAIVQKMKDIAYCKTSKAVRFSEWGRAWCHRN